MRYALISDLHANLEALTSFLEAADSLGIKKIVCLGDIVGYNANPNECVDLVRERGVMCIMGNHDSRAAGLEDSDDFNHQAHAAIEWTKQALTEENREFLSTLPRSILVDKRFLAVHGWVDDTDKYIFGGQDALTNFELIREAHKTNLCFFGHTHVAISYLGMNGSVELKGDNSFKLNSNLDYLINPGALGQPRDRDPKASFLVYDSLDTSVKFYRVEYDVQSAAEKVIRAGLSQRLAERLKLGW
jgi:diadenosine tetraphosphatase ApaH/serine/threonine PP2A family protein phosphatase